MVNYDLLIEYNARKDISLIGNYIFKETWDNLLSSRIYDLLYSKIQSLITLPKRFQLFYKNFRVLHIKSFAIFYIVNDKNRSVKIYRVLRNEQQFKNII